MKALVVDDEELAREEMRLLLGETGRFTDVFVASNEREALECLKANSIGVAFLDIEMPGCSGFQLQEELGSDVMVVFTTAHSEHAVRAFDTGVVDYLIKPIESERLQVAIDRVFAAKTDEVTYPHGEHFQFHSADRVFLRDGERFWLVTIDDIEMLESCGNYTKVFFPGGPAVIRRTLKDFFARLDSKMFFRINRERVINLRRVVHVDATPRGHLQITMPNGQSYEMSRSQTAEFQHRMAV